MINFKTETLEILQEHGKSWDDVYFVQAESFRFSDKSKFLELIDFTYDDGYGGHEINADLVIVGNDWWIECHEYDGSEWWEYKTMPTPLELTKEVTGYKFIEAR